MHLILNDVYTQQAYIQCSIDLANIAHLGTIKKIQKGRKTLLPPSTITFCPSGPGIVLIVDTRSTFFSTYFGEFDSVTKMISPQQIGFKAYFEPIAKVQPLKFYKDPNNPGDNILCFQEFGIKKIC